MNNVKAHEIIEAIQKQRRLLSIFPSKGRNAHATALLQARRAAIEKRIAELEKRLKELERERVRTIEERVRAAEIQAKAPRCIILTAHHDDEGEPMPVNFVLAKYIGQLEPSSPLVGYQDCGGMGAWVPRYQYPNFNRDDVPQDVVERIKKEWEKEYSSWKEFTDSLKEVKEVRTYSYFGDDDELKYGEEIITKWLTPDGKELYYRPSPPKSVAERVEDWWWDNIVGPLQSQIEAEWRAQAISLLNSYGWEVR